MKQTILITSISPKKPITVNGEDVLICDRNRSVTISGPVGKLSVSGRYNEVEASQASVVGIAGEGNQVQVEQLGAAQISGGGNRLFWSKSANGSEPEIGTHGFDNEASKVAAGSKASPVAAATPVAKAQPKPAAAQAKPGSPAAAVPAKGAKAAPAGAKLPAMPKPGGAKPPIPAPGPPVPPPPAKK